MSWAVGYDGHWKRDIGYGVPAICDDPECERKIDRGLAFVCGGDVYGGEDGCGLFFCAHHLAYQRKGDEWSTQLCSRCREGKEPFDPKPDTAEWIEHKLTCPSWKRWRDEYPEKVKEISEQLNIISGSGS